MALDYVVSLLEDILASLRGGRSPWLNVTDAARYVHVKRERMRQLIASGEIESHMVGAGKVVHTDDLDAWVRSQPTASVLPERLLTRC